MRTALFHQDRATATAAVALVASLLLAGCGTSDIDTTRIERELRQSIAAEAKIDPGEVTVDCPGRQENKAGRTFTCTASEDRHRRTVVVRIEAHDTYSATVRTQSSP